MVDSDSHCASLTSVKAQANRPNAVLTNSSSYVSRVMKGERHVDRETLLKWCAIIGTPEWLQERILNAAGYASERQQRAALEEGVVEETHRTVLAEFQRQGKED
jgi:hypothetical protein